MFLPHMNTYTSIFQNPKTFLHAQVGTVSNLYAYEVAPMGFVDNSGKKLVVLVFHVFLCLLFVYAPTENKFAAEKRGWRYKQDNAGRRCVREKERRRLKLPCHETGACALLQRTKLFGTNESEQQRRPSKGTCAPLKCPHQTQGYSYGHGFVVRHARRFKGAGVLGWRMTRA